MKKLYAMILLALPMILGGCKDKKEAEPLFPFYQVLGGDNTEGKNWELAHFYSLRGISTSENVIENGYDDFPGMPKWATDNYYTFFKDGYGLCYEVGLINPQVGLEIPESWDSAKNAYKYIQFNYTGGKTVNIVNRVQKPAFYGDWEIISLNADEMVLYQQDKAFNQEFAIVFKTKSGGI